MSDPQLDTLLPKVAVVILNYNAPQHTTRCVETFLGANYPNLEIVVVDNKSPDGSAEWLREHFPDLPLVCTGANLGYAGGNNAGIKYALANGASYILIVNNDTELINQDLVQEMMSEMESDASVGIIGPQVLNSGDRIQDTVLYTPTIGNLLKSRLCPGFSQYDYKVAHKVESVSGVCWLIRAQVFEAIGLLDQDYFMYAEEQDFCYRATKAGWRIKYVPVVSVLHHKESDSPQRQVPRYVHSRSNLVLFQKKHFGFLPAVFLAALILMSNLSRIVFWAWQQEPDKENSLYSIELLGTLLPKLAEALQAH